MKTDYSMEEFILASGFSLTPWQKEVVNKIASMPPEERNVVLERPRRTRKRYNFAKNFPWLEG